MARAAQIREMVTANYPTQRMYVIVENRHELIGCCAGASDQKRRNRRTEPGGVAASGYRRLPGDKVIGLLLECDVMQLRDGAARLSEKAFIAYIGDMPPDVSNGSIGSGRLSGYLTVKRQLQRARQRGADFMPMLLSSHAAIFSSSPDRARS
jgi:hypothetical protein